VRAADGARDVREKKSFRRNLIGGRSCLCACCRRTGQSNFWAPNREKIAASGEALRLGRGERWIITESAWQLQGKRMKCCFKNNGPGRTKLADGAGGKQAKVGDLR